MPKLLDEIIFKYLDMVALLAADGVKPRSFPSDADILVFNEMERMQQSILMELSILAQIDDGIIQF